MRLAIGLLIYLALTAQGLGAIVAAATCSMDDVNTAVAAAGTSDIVTVPAGTCVWTSRVTVSKGITMQGAGIDATIIQRDTATQGFALRMSANTMWRVTGFTFDGTGIANGMEARGTATDWRIDHNKFINSVGRAIETFGFNYGLIDNNTFEENKSSDVVVFGDNDTAWTRAVTLGTANAVYIEDNTFLHDTVSSNSHSVASNHGARYVFRYNTVNDLTAALNTAPVDAHGNRFFGRGTVSYEIYNNTINSAHSFQGMFIRGGTGIIYNNTLVGDFNLPISLANYQSFTEDSTPCGYMCCTHPCQDQITDLYIWSNTDDGVTITPTVRSLGIQQQHIVLDRDYFLSEKGGSTGFTYPHPLQGDSTWVRDGTDPSDSTITPGGAATKINAFTTSVTEGSDTLTAITATFATGTHLGVDLVELLDSGDDQLATVSDPSSEHITFTGLSESVTTTHFVHLQDHAAQPCGYASSSGRYLSGHIKGHRRHRNAVGLKL